VNVKETFSFLNGVMQQVASSRCDTLSWTVLGRQVVMHCTDAEAHALLQANYGGMQRGSQEATDLRYTVGRQAGSQAFLLRRAGEEPQRAADAGALLFAVEKDCTIALQTLRPDLYFVYAAVLEWAGSAVMLVAASGAGKSTTTWALLHHGFRYCSDELGPVDVQTCEVYPYPHALCLKEEPPAAYPLPLQTLCTPSTLHIPTAALPSAPCTDPRRLAAIFFVQYRPEAAGPTVRPMRTAEAVARLFAQALNPLAHAEEGLDGAIALASRCPCFALHTADLPATCALMVRTLHELFHGAQQGDGYPTPRRDSAPPRRGEAAFRQRQSQ
jgi:hypothetical protein